MAIARMGLGTKVYMDPHGLVRVVASDDASASAPRPGETPVRCVRAVRINIVPQDAIRAEVELLPSELDIGGAEPDLTTTIGGVEYRLVRKEAPDA